ncbi:MULTISPECIES: NDMA-dependent alcohol dehydrogenase [Mycolicibacterium]|jgi:S-(hydroxymethyl)glutathione dehydrogenase/alcohol dehydrogenase|uniref:NDMA-dependent alcohol dehydrogenase n=1 Tax=Mycolicibacterium TaxID=1866885 RepID=UPI00055B7E2F|nr:MULTISPECIES: NDMA-dependent alcohol dehydrogenase [Mycolicibacterium]MDW5612176.1 NDMA-dependent alcohol dehydrogenase [Mycolicibacterium sp. D5.8-2]QZY45488.1 NDMA-dependent alcohol dehydrogenase [Mycolicibacterium austroafricanum]UJL29247.1 NDMA-dependent alcohol dehydrogenase [Mycolicibacterium vanbaalenii]WND55975.1 NDMA-dependent alcohol dehydrogenase [Mycolicibacterium vanbaalenii]
MKTKGALIWEFNQPWTIEEIEIGDPVKDEVKIQMEASGMCHSDHHLVTGDIPMAGFPVLGGHEGAGVVTEVGPGVEGLEPGDHVVLSFIPSCGSCPSCQAGMRNLCDLGAMLLQGTAVSDNTHRIHAKDGTPVIPMTLLGTFSPYMVVHKSSVVKIDPSIPFEVACLVGCGVTTGYGSAVRSANVRPGDDVVIAGIGGVGMGALQGALNAGARTIFAIDPVEWKRDQALKFGATHAYPDIFSAMAGVAEVTQGRMASKTIITTGELHGEEIDNYLNITAKGGTCVVTAVANMASSEVTMNLSMLTLLQKNLQGTIFGGGNPHHDIPQLLSIYKAGRLNLDDMVTRQYKLEQINEGYKDMLEGKNIRGVIRYTDADR